MMILYRLSRGAGHSIVASLAFALFNRRVPGPTEAEREQQDRDYMERVADFNRRSRKQQ
jgi:hypothetical protein